MNLEKALKSGVVILGLLAGAGAGLLLGGCSSAPHMAVVADEFEAPIALAAVGAPMRLEQAPTRDHFRLGAGDALGAALFSNDAEIVRANGGWQYASGNAR